MVERKRPIPPTKQNSADRFSTNLSSSEISEKVPGEIINRSVERIDNPKNENQLSTLFG